MDSVGPRDAALRASESGSGGVDSRASWRMAWLVLAILSVSYASPLLIVVGMKPMQEALGTERSVLALAGSLVWVGTGSGGILMGWLADRIGLRRTVSIGAVMIAGGLALSSLGSIWALYVGHALLGFLGNGGVYPPLLVYVSRWFERRRGAAIALISSGQYVAGVVWPAVFERGMTTFGWQPVMLVFGVFALGFILPAIYFLKEPPKPPPVAARHAASASGGRPKVAGFPPNVAQALLCLAGFFCCIPMSIPSAHIVAFCGDIGIKPTHGAAMLSLMLGCAFLARQAWGSLADRIGGLRTVMAGSACQAVAIALFLLTQDEVGLFAVSAAFGLGFAGIIPSYSVAVRDLFPASEAAWRMPLTLFTAMSGMAFGSWFAGALYDHFGYYAPAFGIAVIFNLLNLTIISFLVWRTGGTGRTLVWPTARPVA
ncbi:MFS transporter [Reyranella sp.]|uniref:MFS transporter n=1 Tax=Reyranella sp. TaxID=1929291 RepID=UPI0025EAAEB1|nr:MFS transporter [Reyranella sp.]